MLTRETITVGRLRFRVAPWQGREHMAVLSVPGNQARPTTTDIHAALEMVRSRGYREVVTSALAERDTDPFVELGFVESDRLHVLEHTLDTGWADKPVFGTSHRAGSRTRIRRGRRRDRPAVLELDHRAFPRFWRLDADGLKDAKDATPSTHFTIAANDRTPVGYSVTGRGGTSGFLQRLATDPDHQRHGIATALVADALRWCDTRRCERVLVNTQVTNTAALALYLSLGFDKTPNDLVVLSWALP